MSESLAVYPGSFDPVTNGHLDLVERGIRIFNKLIVAVVNNPGKEPLFSLEERIDMLRETTRKYGHAVQVDSFDGLLVDYLVEKKAVAYIRGLRAVSDYEYEFEMAMTNRRLVPEVETVFFAPSEDFTFLRASTVKEVAKLGGNISSFVPPYVEQYLKEKFQKL